MFWIWGRLREESPCGYLPEVFGQLLRELRLLFLHVLHDCIVCVTDFDSCGGHAGGLHTDSTDTLPSCSLKLINKLQFRFSENVKYVILIFIMQDSLIFFFIYLFFKQKHSSPQRASAKPMSDLWPWSIAYAFLWPLALSMKVNKYPHPVLATWAVICKTWTS